MTAYLNAIVKAYCRNKIAFHRMLFPCLKRLRVADWKAPSNWMILMEEIQDGFDRLWLTIVPRILHDNGNRNVLTLYDLQLHWPIKIDDALAGLFEPGTTVRKQVLTRFRPNFPLSDVESLLVHNVWTRLYQQGNIGTDNAVASINYLHASSPESRQGVTIDQRSTGRKRVRCESDSGPPTRRSGCAGYIKEML